MKHKLCINCKYCHVTLSSSDDPQVLGHQCKKVEISVVHGKKNDHFGWQTCDNERYFPNKCGLGAKNFEPKDS